MLKEGTCEARGTARPRPKCLWESHVLPKARPGLQGHSLLFSDAFDKARFWMVGNSKLVMAMTLTTSGYCTCRSPVPKPSLSLLTPSPRFTSNLRGRVVWDQGREPSPQEPSPSLPSHSEPRSFVIRRRREGCREHKLWGVLDLL